MKNTNNEYHPRYTHSLAYYRMVIENLIKGLNAHENDEALAKRLNKIGILSPRGKQWTTTAVKQALFKMRHHKEVPSRLHQSLLQLCFDNQLKASDTFILFTPRAVLNAH